MSVTRSTEVNFAENQARRDRGELSLTECHRIGREHAAYGWSPAGMGFKPSAEQQAAYLEGYEAYGKALPHVSPYKP